MVRLLLLTPFLKLLGSGVTIDGVLIRDNAITASGEIDGGSLDISGNADIDGTTFGELT